MIGNPPWDRIKLQEVEWFATRRLDLALAPTAAARRAGIRKLRRAGDPLVDDYDNAMGRADRMGQFVRGSGHYPLLGRGDINLYSLFVERAMSLVKPDGFVGLLTPSGIYADKTAARFFKSVSTTGRVSSILDFENRRLGTDLPPFFPDVDSRFKFCALIFGGAERRFDDTECAFFMPGPETVSDPEPVLLAGSRGLRAGESEHGDRAGLSHTTGRGDYKGASTSVIRCWWTDRMVTSAGRGRSDIIANSIWTLVPATFVRRRSSKLMAFTQ